MHTSNATAVEAVKVETPPQPPDGKSPADIAIKNGRECHRKFDTKDRELKGILAKSKANENTQGTTFEVALEKFIASAKQADDRFLELEQLYSSGQVLSPAQCQEIHDICDAQFECMKQATNKAAALKSWFSS